MTFILGIELSRRFYAEAVAPVVGGPHSAALVGPGSEVLGFDTGRSTDHDWTARVFLFLPEPRELPVPATFLGQPVKLVVATLDGWTRGFLGFDPRHPAPRDWLATPTQVFAEFTGGAVRVPAKSRVQPPGFRRCRATDPSPLARARDPDVANDSFATPEAPHDSFAAPNPASPGPVSPPPRQGPP